MFIVSIELLTKKEFYCESLYDFCLPFPVQIVSSEWLYHKKDILMTLCMYLVTYLWSFSIIIVFYVAQYRQMINSHCRLFSSFYNVIISLNKSSFLLKIRKSLFVLYEWQFVRTTFHFVRHVSFSTMFHYLLLMLN
jgi:hypothetical protein